VTFLLLRSRGSIPNPSDRVRLIVETAFSDGLVVSPVLKRRQAVSEPDPCYAVTEPRMMSRRKCSGRVEAAGGDVDGVRGIGVFIGQRRSARSAEGATNRLGRMKHRRPPRNELELRNRECKPGDDRRSGHSPARLAMADHGVRRPAAYTVANRPAGAASLGNRIRHPDPLPSKVRAERALRARVESAIRTSARIRSPTATTPNRSFRFPAPRGRGVLSGDERRAAKPRPPRRAKRSLPA